MADKKNRVPVREQAPEVRAKNFEEVCLGYNKEEAMEEASRCLNCKNARCITGCPVNINIPAFIAEVKEGNFEKASQVIGESSALPAICGRVCPQESQCEGKCILGIKGEPVSIGKLERFTADWARENNIAPIPAKEKKGKKVAVIGSGPAGLTVFLCQLFHQCIEFYLAWVPLSQQPALPSVFYLYFSDFDNELSGLSVCGGNTEKAYCIGAVGVCRVCAFGTEAD